jgi:hypothetical protein
MTTTLQSLGPGFATTLVRLALPARIDPKGAAALMLSESGLVPSARNSIGCVGINQLCGSSQRVFAPLSVAQYRSLSASGQLPYVFRFWNSLNRKGAAWLSGRDLYWLNFLPATYVPGAPDSHVIVPPGSGYYAANASLDHGHKGYITAGDLWIALANAMHKNPALWNALSAAIDGAELKTGVATFGVVVLAGLAVGAMGYLAVQEAA